MFHVEHIHFILHTFELIFIVQYSEYCINAVQDTISNIDVLVHIGSKRPMDGRKL